MIKPNIALAFLLTGLLAACGGGSGDSVVPETGTGTGTGDDGTTGTVDNGDGTTDDITTGTNIENPRLGTGTGSGFVSGTLKISSTNLSAGGTTNVSAVIVDSDNGNAKIVSQKYGVVFTSTCSESDPAKASFSRANSITSSGEVSVTYEAQGCSGTDIISFKLYPVEGSNVQETELLHTATGTVTVQPPEVGSITYVSTDSPAISVSTIANSLLPRLTDVIFKVVDETNNPIAGKSVEFSLSNTNGGITLALDSGITDENGQVKAVVRGGTTHAITSVKATTLANDNVTEITTNSLPISVTTGLPRQDRFTLSLNTFNPGAYNVDSVVVGVTATLGDAFGNPVPDGTVVNFTAESGLVGSSCETTGGRCSVSWSSGGVRPGNADVSLNLVNEQIGMTTILAYSQGEAGFTDGNADFLFDTNEPFLAYEEPFRDDNWNSLVDVNAGQPVEAFIDSDYNGTHSAAPSLYQGALCSTAARGLGHCGSLMHVRAQTRLMQSVANSVVMRFFNGSAPFVETTTPSLDPSGSGSFCVVLQDDNGNIPASGTTFSAAGDGYKIYGSTGVVPNSVGKIEQSGMPDYGAVYCVDYELDGIPVEIVVTATSGSLTRSQRLQ